MKKHIEHLLLSLLVATTILLGLTFWLNTNFGFNIFSKQHWYELALLQASGENIDKNFYLSIGIALGVFIICLNIIYRPRFKKLPKPAQQSVPTHTPQPTNAPAPVIEHMEEKSETPPAPQPKPEHNVNLVRPPRLNLPKNTAEIAAMQYNQQMQDAAQRPDRHDDGLAQIFTEHSFVTKKNPMISGFKPNLFAIGANEVVWIGGVDCDSDKLNTAVQRLNQTFQETLEDITITVNAFLVDTNDKYTNLQNILVFHSIDDLRQYISEHPGDTIDDSNREDFDAYSDYIDTVLTLLYKT